MSKVIGAVIALAALATAFYLLLRRQPFRATRPGRFWVLVGGFLTFMGASCTQSAEGGGGSPKGDAQQAPQPAKASRPEAHANWSKIKAAVAEVRVVTGGDFGKMDQKVRSARQEMKGLLAPLVAEGLVSAPAAEVLAVLHGDRTFHYTRQLATCYMGYFQPQGCRDDMEKRLALLAQAARQGKLAPVVVAKAERAAKRDMELLVRLNVILDKQRAGGGEAAQQEYKDLQTLMAKFHPKWLVAEGDADLPARAGVAEALDLMRFLIEPAASQGS